jgi:hypothetical protein
MMRTAQRVAVCAKSFKHHLSSVPAGSGCARDSNRNTPGAFTGSTVTPDRTLGRELSLKQQLGQRVFDTLLDGPLERTGTEHRVEAHLGQLGQRLLGHLHSVHLLQTAFQQRSWILAIASMFLASRAWKTTVSSMRFKNSGRKWF